MTNKKEAAVLAHRDPRKVRGIQAGRTLTTILPRMLRRVKQLLCRMLCILMALLAVAFMGSWIQGMRSFSEMCFCAGVCMMLAASLLIYTEGGEQ